MWSLTHSEEFSVLQKNVGKPKTLSLSTELPWQPLKQWSWKENAQKHKFITYHVTDHTTNLNTDTTYHVNLLIQQIIITDKKSYY